MSKTIYYSISTLQNIATCPARIYYRQLAKQGIIKEDIALPFVFGIAGHEGIEAKLKFGTDTKTTYNKYLKDNFYDKYTVENLREAEITEDKIKDRSESTLKGVENFDKFVLPRLLDANKGKDIPSRVEVKYEMPFRGNGVMVGIVDFDGEDDLLDWKFGKTPKKFQDAARAGMPITDYDNIQAANYYNLRKNVLGIAPEKFSFVYLEGTPTKKTQEMDEDGRPLAYKSGPRKGEPKMTWDFENGVRFKFPVIQTPEHVARMFNEYINPLAEIYEQGIVYKNPGWGDQNCTGCSYRTACRVDRVPLPNRVDYGQHEPPSLEKVSTEE